MTQSSTQRIALHVIVPVLVTIFLFVVTIHILLQHGFSLDSFADDVAFFEYRIRLACIVIMVIALVLSAYVVWHARKMEKERQEVTKTLERHARDLKRRNEEIRRFAYIVSHDLRAPLINISGFINILKQAKVDIDAVIAKLLPSLPQDHQARLHTAVNEDIPEAISFITSSVERMNRQIEAILQLSRLERREMEFERVDMNVLVRECVKVFMHRIEEQAIDLQLQPLPTITADQQSIERMICNLLDNAIKYMPADRQGLIEIGYKQRPDDALFWVRDNGCGVDEKDITRIFEIFRRSGGEEVPGEGMGLAYAQTILSLHHGEIWCESNGNSGATFYFNIPRDPQYTFFG
ncbi:MAG: hypothetical protein EOM20_12390 [Spartobacteria bacterium]|nr:hypothetical protein [Spartobacteria bacterium]